jgi:hypothetical protein
LEGYSQGLRILFRLTKNPLQLLLLNDQPKNDKQKTSSAQLYTNNNRGWNWSGSFRKLS